MRVFISGFVLTILAATATTTIARADIPIPSAKVPDNTQENVAVDGQSEVIPAPSPDGAEQSSGQTPALSNIDVSNQTNPPATVLSEQPALDPAILQHSCLASVGVSAEQAAQWEQQGLLVGTVEVKPLPIFDENNPDENNWLFRWVNRLHIDTRPKVINDDLLFRTGEPFSAQKVAESERILRTRRYFHDATIVAVGDCKKQVDLQVRAHEVWTLLPEIGYSHKGGGTTSRFGIKDKNFLGSGKELSVQRENGVDRTTTEFGYNDPNWGVSHGVLDVEYGDSSDGKYYNVDLTRPFYALDATWSAYLSAHEGTLTDKQYFRGDAVNAFQHDDGKFSIAYGWSAGLEHGRTWRYLIGINDERDKFSTVTDTNDINLIPIDRHYRYPWLGFEYIEDRFIKAVNVNQISVTEDYNLGWKVGAHLGYSDPQFGAEDTAVVSTAQATRSFLINDDQVVVFSVDWHGYYQSNTFRNAVLTSALQYHLGDFATHQFYAALQVDSARQLSADQLLYLGGDNGLRGYPSRYQVGQRRVLLTLEERFYTSYEFLKLFNVGAAVFVDAGRAWFTDQDSSVNDGILRDAGMGLRFSPTRTGSHRTGHHAVVHMDLAFPLDRTDDISRWQWLVQVKESF